MRSNVGKQRHLWGIVEQSLSAFQDDYNKGKDRKETLKIGLYIMVKKLPTELFNKIYRQVPRLCVDIIVCTTQGIVLTKRLIPPCIGMWHIPGGTVLFGEKLEEAANRIANEEIGVDVKIKSTIGIIEYLELFNYSVGVVFLCELKSEEQEFRGSFQAEEIKAFKTIPDNTIVEQKKFLIGLQREYVKYDL